MIQKIANIEKVNYEVYGEPYIKGVTQVLETGRWEGVALPLNFNFNGFWKVEHICYSCNQATCFGNEPTPHHIYPHFIKLKMLWTRYYSEAFLQVLNRVFPESTRVLYLKKHQHYILTKVDFKDESSEVLYVPYISISYHQCIHCGADFLSRYRFGAGAWPERGNWDGSLNQMFFDEMVNIKVAGEKSFMQLVKAAEKQINQ